MGTLPAIAIRVIAPIVLALGATNAITCTQSVAGYFSVGFHVGITQEDHLKSIAQSSNLALGLYQQIVVGHAGTFPCHQRTLRLSR